jgi:hypothetical protein
VVTEPAPIATSMACQPDRATATAGLARSAAKDGQGPAFLVREEWRHRRQGKKVGPWPLRLKRERRSRPGLVKPNERSARARPHRKMELIWCWLLQLGFAVITSMQHANVRTIEIERRTAKGEWSVAPMRAAKFEPVVPDWQRVDYLGALALALADRTPSTMGWRVRLIAPLPSA